jgi:release factor glutamine methyltransferase
VTIKETLDFGAAFLSRKGVDSPQVNADSLIAYGLGLPNRLSLYLQFERALTEEEVQKLRALFVRRGERVPLQHIIGTVQFGAVQIKSDERALIPRPETEMLVQELVREASARPPGTLADIGTGSGAILLGFLAQCVGWRGVGVDVSEQALALARENVGLLGMTERVSLVAGDLVSPLTSPVELVAANLPYIPSEKMAELPPEVLRDPVLALDGGSDGLELVRCLLENVSEVLVPGGMVIMEVGCEQVAPLVDQMREGGWQGVRGIADMTGRSRFVAAHRPT